MGSIRKRGDKWQAQIRRRGSPGFSRSFLLKTDAQAWARQKEIEADRRGLTTGHKVLGCVSVGAIVTRYRDEIVPRKRGADRETTMINAFLRRPIAQVAVADLTTGMVSADCSERLRKVKPATVNRELDILRHALAVARRNWDLPLTENAFAMVTRPKSAGARTRRLMDGERRRLEDACGGCRNASVLPLIQLALETAMRRGEILSARWQDLSIQNRTLLIPTTKNGHPRTIPLSGAAVTIFRSLEQRRVDCSEFILPLTTNAAKMAWKRIVKRAGFIDLRFHDLRHEAVSSFFERGLSVPEVALISGHRDVRMLFRYTHPKAELIAEKLK